MKKLIAKSLCLLFSFVLLFSNVQIFAQEISAPNLMAEINVVDLQRNLESLRLKFKQAEKSLNNLLKELENAPHYTEYLVSVYEDLPKESWEALSKWKDVVNEPSSKYFKYFKNYKNEMTVLFNEHMLFVTDVNLAKKYVQNEASKRIIERLGYKYTSVPAVYPGLKKLELGYDMVLDFFEDMLQKANPSDVKLIQKEFENMHTYFNIRFTVDSNNFSKVATDALKIDNKTYRYIRDIISPKDVIKYAYEHLSVEQRNALRLVLQLPEEETTLLSTVREIRRHIRYFGTKSTDNFSFFKLLRRLRPMDQAARAEYIKQVTGFTPGQKQLLKDISALDKKFIRKTILWDDTLEFSQKTFGKALNAGILIGIGAVVSAVTIREVKSNNNFNNYTLTPAALAKIKKDIENGTANEEDIWLFYSSESSEKAVVSDSFHTLNFIKLAADIADAEYLIQNIQKQNKEEEIENKIIENSTNIRSLEKFGLGTL